MLVAGASESLGDLNELKRWRDSLLSQLSDENRTSLSTNTPTLPPNFPFLQKTSSHLTTAKVWISLACRTTVLHDGVRGVATAVAQLDATYRHN